MEIAEEGSRSRGPAMPGKIAAVLRFKRPALGSRRIAQRGAQASMPKRAKGLPSPTTRMGGFFVCRIGKYTQKYTMTGGGCVFKGEKQVAIICIFRYTGIKSGFNELFAADRKVGPTAVLTTFFYWFEDETASMRQKNTNTRGVCSHLLRVLQCL